MLVKDFPKSLPEFLERFGSEEACQEYLFQQKWPEGFKCDRCGCTEANLLPTRHIYVCYGCRATTASPRAPRSTAPGRD